MSRKRLNHQLEMQSLQIEQIMAHHEIEGEVAGGRVETEERRISFDVKAQLSAGWERLQLLKEDLKKVLGSLDVQVQAENGRVRVDVLQPHRPPVELVEMLELVGELPPLTAVLGWAADERPVLLNFKCDETCHAFVAGSSGTGKTMLLRSLVLSLAQANKEPRLQFVIIDPHVPRQTNYKHSGLRPFAHLPHLLTPIITFPEDAIEMLEFLVSETRHRMENNIQTPAIVVVIEEIDFLLGIGQEAILRPLMNLIIAGAAAGIHLVLSTAHPEAKALEDLLESYIPARLVGRLEHVTQAELATEVLDSQAERLRGEGDFVAVAGGLMINFQVAFAGEYDVHLALETMQRERPPALLAQVFYARPHLQITESLTEYVFGYEASADFSQDSVEPLEGEVLAIGYDESPAAVLDNVKSSENSLENAAQVKQKLKQDKANVEQSQATLPAPASISAKEEDFEADDDWLNWFLSGEGESEDSASIPPQVTSASYTTAVLRGFAATWLADEEETAAAKTEDKSALITGEDSTKQTTTPKSEPPSSKPAAQPPKPPATFGNPFAQLQRSSLKNTAASDERQSQEDDFDAGDEIPFTWESPRANGTIKKQAPIVKQPTPLSTSLENGRRSKPFIDEDAADVAADVEETVYESLDDGWAPSAQSGQVGAEETAAFGSENLATSPDEDEADRRLNSGLKRLPNGPSRTPNRVIRHNQILRNRSDERRKQ